jgi:putative oxidoreductase
MKTSFNDGLMFLGRVCLAAIFIYGSIAKIRGYAQTARLMDAHHVSGHLLPIVIALELLGGLALIGGLYTRLVAAVLSIFSIAAISIFVWPPANPMMVIVMLAEVGLVGGLLSYAASGAGRFSLDRLWLKKT